MSNFVAKNDPRVLAVLGGLSFRSIGQASVIDGGFSDDINGEIWNILNNLEENPIADDENFEEFIVFSQNYLDEILKDNWILESDEMSSSDFEYLQQNNLPFLIKALSGEIERFIIRDDEVVKLPFRLNIEQSDEIFKTIETLIAENRFEEIVGTTVVSYIVENNFSFDDFIREISSLVDQRLEKENFQFSLPGWLFDQYLGIDSIIEDGKYVYRTSASNKTLPLSLGDKIKELILPGTSEASKTGGLQGTPDALWPDVLSMKASGEDPSLLEEIVILDDQDLSQYPFSYFKTINRQYYWFENPFERFTRGEESSTNETINLLIKKHYSSFIISIYSDFIETGSLNETVGRKYREFLEDETFLSKISLFILYDKEIARRISLWNSLSDFVDEDGDLSEEDEEAARNRATEAWKSGKAPKLKDKRSKEDIANRQKFFKQCALMMNMPTLKRKYNEILRGRYENGKLFDDRFYMAYCGKGGQEKLLSNLLTSADEQALMEIPGHVLSSLVPKVRLYKVTEKGDRVENTELIFNATADDSLSRAFSSSSNVGNVAAAAASAAIGTSLGVPQIQVNQAPKFLGEEFDKGSGCGLKEFSFEFNGTNPAEARNDIKATLKLYFQSFSDFIRERKASNGKSYKYVDLIIQPTPDKKQKINGIEVISERQYEPSFYRIRADVGYHLDNIKDEKIRKALEVSNKSMFLNMVDHNIQFKNDGSVEVSISYRAYLESLLKHPRLDALASPELIKKRQGNARLLAQELSKKQCSKEQIQELQVSIAATEDSILKRSLSSIIDRLRSRGVIYTTQITEEDRNQFLSEGFFRKCRLRNDIVVPKLDQNCTFQGDKNKADVGVVLNTSLPENAEDFNFLNSANGIVQFFFFGDLLYTILDCVYKDGSKLRSNSGFQNSKILLGSFEFDPFQITGVGDRIYNIAHIPISVDFFSRWFVEEVMAQKSTRKTFPVLNFVRNLTNQLIKPSLLDNCVNRSVDKTLRFQTSQITAYHDKNKGVDPLNKFNKPKEKAIGMEVMSLRDKKSLPLKGGGASDDPNNLFNYIVLSTAGSSLSFSGSGKYKKDIEQGRLHVNIGQNNGLVKSISLSKSDQQYIREARFFQQGIDGLMQLSAVYVATLEMFGNTLFYPGMEFFFNPYGLGGGTEFGSPTTAGSVANKLGIGGYHTITSVRSSITPGSFKTTVAGQQYYSGDGSGNPNLRGKGAQNKESESLDAYVPENLDEDACESVILDVQRFEPDAIESRPADDIEDNGVDREEADFREANESSTSTEEIDPFGESDNSEDRFGTSEQE